MSLNFFLKEHLQKRLWFYGNIIACVTFLQLTTLNPCCKIRYYQSTRWRKLLMQNLRKPQILGQIRKSGILLSMLPLTFGVRIAAHNTTKRTFCLHSYQFFSLIPEEGIEKGNGEKIK